MRRSKRAHESPWSYYRCVTTCCSGFTAEAPARAEHAHQLASAHHFSEPGTTQSVADGIPTEDRGNEGLRSRGGVRRGVSDFAVRKMAWPRGWESSWVEQSTRARGSGSRGRNGVRGRKGPLFIIGAVNQSVPEISSAPALTSLECRVEIGEECPFLTV